MEHCIVYFSQWEGQFSEEDLVTILEQSRFDNRKAGITGVTLYVRGSIIQVLEGEKPTIEALYERIEVDQHHTNVVKVLNRPISKRLFADYTMGYQTITARQLEEIKTVVDLNGREEVFIKSKEPIILRMIKVFYQSSQYN